MNTRISLQATTGESVWCYMLDASHPEVAARYGDCESYYSLGQPGFVRLCYRTAATSPAEWQSAGLWFLIYLRGGKSGRLLGVGPLDNERGVNDLNVEENGAALGL